MARIDMQQGSDEWHALRRTKIGGSDAPAIMGVSKYRSRLMVWEEKVLNKSQADNWAMKKGREWEPRIRQRVSDEMRLELQPAVFVSDEHPFMMASLDGICGAEVFEIKRACEEDHQIARSGKVPKHYMPQLQHIMMTLEGINGMTYVSSHMDDLVYVGVDLDKQYCLDLLNEEEEFYNNNMLLYEMPEVSDLDKLCKDSDPDFVAHWMKARLYKEQMDDLEFKYENEKQYLIQKSEGRSVEGSLGKLTKFVEKGRVDYKAIPELKKVNLDKYRKEPSEKWKLSFAESV